MKSRLRLLVPAIRELGWSSLRQFGGYRLQLRFGLLKRRTPISEWSDLAWQSNPTAETGVFPAPLTSPQFESLLQFDTAELINEADQIVSGRFRLFGGPAIELGQPPDWGTVPLAVQMPPVPLTEHWSDYSDDGEIDFRLLWEPARMGWMFTLCRAYLRTQDSKYAESAVNLWNSWKESNPPNRGPHWMSGQEIALRVFALLTMRYSLADHVDTTDLEEAIAFHAHRITQTLDYARAQRNNFS